MPMALKDQPTTLPDRGGELQRITSDGATLSFTVSGQYGAPLLLIHSINAAASSAEVEPLRAHYLPGRLVYAMDLPGFGNSDRSDRPYTPRLMTDAILDVAREAVARSGEPVDALAVSLSSEFLARAASEQPSLFHSVAFVSPTGFSGTRSLRQQSGSTRGHPLLYRMLRGPGWGRGLYRLLTRPGVIRYFLRRTWGAKNIDERLWQADMTESRRAGAQFAPLYFLAGELFSADIHTVYDTLRSPVWVSHGRRGDFVDFRQLEDFATRRSWQVDVFDTGALPYFEQPGTFAEAYDHFMSTLPK